MSGLSFGRHQRVPTTSPTDGGRILLTDLYPQAHCLAEQAESNERHDVQQCVGNHQGITRLVLV